MAGMTIRNFVEGVRKGCDEGEFLRAVEEWTASIA
jgi:hypothetical protein